MALLAGKRNGKISFKNLVRSIIRASRWKISIVGAKDGTSSEDLANKTWYEDKDTLHFNVNAFKAGNSSNAGLSKRAKFILMKNAWERTEEELELIHTVVDQMKCFEKYPPMVRRELTRVMHFETFEDGRVMLQEGHQGFSMYFIVAGSVIVQVSQEDGRTHEKRTQTVGEISAGSSFGELALIQDCTRTATIVCKGTSQFLRVDKPDFDMVLRRSYEKEWDDRLQVLLSIPFFKQWNDFDMRNLNLNCRIEEFSSGSVIVGNTSEVSENVYFVVFGVCKLIRQVKVLLTFHDGKTIITLPNKSSRLSSNNTKASYETTKIQTRFLEIGLIEHGDYFGVGENMSGAYVIASGRVECLVIPRHVILSLERLDTTSEKVIRKVGAVKEMLKHTKSRMLSEEEAYDKWMVNLGWKNYKKKIASEILSLRGIEYKRQTGKPSGLPKLQERKKIEPNLHHKRNIVLNTQKKKMASSLDELR
ncbi:cGMP-dependent protein kinase 2-like [Styela clava]|uniref:cGMP-dependent protein kinase 2-like n=1 Tax=Styela clava TaxID=7725 RepID=UPI00193A7C4B|nr:cGMP-dependent protein kinase 2-like [Styela clava]